MRIDTLWHDYTILFAHNLAAVHGKRYSLVMLYREGKVQSCEGFAKEWFDRQHTNTSSFYWEGFGEGQRRHAVSKYSDYLRKVLQSIPLCTFASLAAYQWKRGWFRPHPRGSGAQQIEAITEWPHTVARRICWVSYGGLPWIMLSAQWGWQSVKGREENCGKEGLPGALTIYFSLAAACSITW